MSKIWIATAAGIALATVATFARQGLQPDWKAVEDETMRHFQTVLRFDTQNPPGNETTVADYL